MKGLAENSRKEGEGRGYQVKSRCFSDEQQVALLMLPGYSGHFVTPFVSQTKAHPTCGARTDFSASGARRKKKKKKSKQRPLEARPFSLGRDFSKKGWGGSKSLLSGTGRCFFPEF